MKKLLALLLSLVLVISLTACVDTYDGSYDYEEPAPEYTVDIKVICEENLIFSKYDVNVYFDDFLEGTVKHGKTKKFTVTVTEGTYNIDFICADDEEICETIEVDIIQNESLEFKITCKMFGMDVEMVKGPKGEKEETNNEEKEDTTSDTDIVVTENAKDLLGLKKEDVEQKFKDMGFKEIEFEKETTEDINKNDTVQRVEIVWWIFGEDDFKKGDKFGDDEKVVITYYEYKEPEKPSPVYYSTNDYDTACNGNSGVFAYKSKDGSYDRYWIIDFDAGYVYFFTDGNGETYCDKVKITSGTLNDKVTITWKEGKTKWYLYFKYVSAPSILISRDHLGIMVEFSPTNLDKALQLRNTKTIINS